MMGVFSRWFKHISLFTAGLSLLVSSLPIVNAQSAPTSSGLSITPVISQYTIKPGAQATLGISLKNVTTNEIIAQAQINDFVADGTTGSPKILSATSPPSPYSIRSFVSAIPNLPLKPSEKQKISVTITIPNGTSAGAYFGVIRFKAVPVGANIPNPGQVALTASVGTIVLITVPGNIRQQVQFNGIHVYHGNSDSSFFLTKPNKIGIEIRNLGNGFIQPFGTVEIQDMFNKSVENYQFNNPQQLGNVLPNSTRIFTKDISSMSRIGKYTITATVAYGSGSDVLTLKKTVWYIPLWLGVLILLILIVLLYLAFRAYRRFRLERKRAYRRRG